MTPLMITLFIVTGIAILIVIGLLNNMVESNKLAKARDKLELTDRLRRCGRIDETFPGQLMTPALKQLLARLELNISQRLLQLDKQDAPLKARLEALQAEIAKGDDIAINNPPLPIMTEDRAKEVRFLLEALHAQVTRAGQEGFLSTVETKHWANEIRGILVLLHIEFFNNLGQQLLGEGLPGRARLAFERGVQYLKSQPDAVLYQEQLQYLQKMLKRTNAMVLSEMEPTGDEVNELTDGLKADEKEDPFQKKANYD
ncbi:MULTISPECIES: hypothetical protein [Pseudomonas]|uniref:Uncharacterized protein n=1 Tax=Pseudomonas coleopterorum TaxID=1605838 RepID=A0ABR9BV03_9PSED|nr:MULTISPECIES: hypothetical protein [Pseudomonas]RZA29695.1 MAG: hypothetical protein EOP02_03750 [Pseudomonadota bacterium]KQQ64180.1 hypothetical protein ASF66_07745 [Pseudomonas sp. Leaf129]MBD8480788.1 hypothetical protein [Pseudomonas coleopterorum]MBD8754662.1 hypothetical protein [Pseudomonas coleopterorum]MBD8768342.1 hypothetical protein [Pseudomonas coleopterorum]